MSITPVGTSAASLATSLTSLSLFQQLGFAHLTAESAALDALRVTLGTLNGNPSQCERLSLSQEVCQDLSSFVQGDHSEPSQALLQALSAKPAEFRAFVAEFHPDLLGASDPATVTGRGLEYEGLSETARAQRDRFIHEAVDRLLEGMHERSRTSLSATPKAISLKDVLDHPDLYRDKPLEIALFDVDGTTHKGEAFYEGQYSIEWLLRDVLRHGPKATAGFGWGRLLNAIPGIIKLRLQEKAHQKKGGPDRGLFAETFRPILKGLDAKLARESLERFYNRFGRRGVSEFMKAEFERHRQKNRLIIGVSASLEILVKMHAKDLGVPEENMLGTMIEVDENEKATGNFRWLHGEEKVAALEELVFKPLRDRGIQFKLVAGYSDSPSDKPMLSIVKQDGGVAYATNASKDAFKAEVLADGGIAVDEEDGWFNNGVRQLMFASSETGEFYHREKTPGRRPAWVDDVGNYTKRVLSDTAGAALAAPISELAHQAMAHGGHAGLSADLLASAPTMAVGAFFGSALTMVMVPPDGPVSWWRRVIMRGMAPLFAAMLASGNLTSFLPMMTALFVASAGTEIVTAGERVVGLRRWRGGDERKNPVGKTIGFFGYRSLQYSAYRALLFLFQRAAGA